ncbi:MAG: hypothetical protein GX308_08065 [Epulopiscium sp.]|nr:hypothetical protein [Candidatus Epulonipiscium sp.]
MGLIFEKIKSLYSVWFMVLTVGIGVLTIFNDAIVLKSKKYVEEAKWARYIGLIYIIGGLGVFIVLKVLS